MDKEPRVIMILNIKLDGDRSEDIEIHEDEDSEDVAQRFCEKHSLPEAVKEVLAKNIEENLDIYIQEQLEKTNNNLSSTNSHIKNLNSSLGSHKKSISSRNYGEVLYAKGLMMKQKVEHMVQTQKQSMLEVEMKNSTFKPKISPYTVKNRTASSGFSRKRSQNFDDEQLNCTFQPKITKYKGKSRENKEKSDKCVELYKGAVALKQKLESEREKIFNEIYTFQPNSTKKRLNSSLRSSKRKKVYLTSDKIQQLRNLFMILCPDSKGNINKQTVGAAKIPEKVYKLCGRIVDELVELNESLNFDEFCKAMEILETEDVKKCRNIVVNIPDEFS